MNMKLILGMIGISVIILSATGYLATISDKYDSTADMSGFNKTETRLTRIHQISNETYSDLYSAEAKESDISILYWAFKVGKNSIKTVWANFRLFTTMIGESYSILADQGLIPGDATSWLLLSILSIFFISVTIWLISIFMKWYV